MNLSNVKFGEVETTRPFLEPDIDEATRRAPVALPTSWDSDGVDFGDRWNGCDSFRFISAPITPVEQLEGESIKYPQVDTLATTCLIGFLAVVGLAFWGRAMGWW